MKTSLFTPDAIDKIVRETITPETDANHGHVVVGAVDTTGAQVVVGFERRGNGLTWQVAAAYHHDWTTKDDEVGGKVLLKW